MRRNSIPYVKRTRAKGKEYFYFDTGEVVDGKRIYTALPHIDSGTFWDSYAACKGHRERREKKDSVFTFAKLLDRYYASPAYRALAPNTHKLYERYLDALLPVLGSAPAGDITPPEIRRASEKLNMKAAQHNVTVGALAGLYKFARRNDLVPHDCFPARDVERMDIGEHEPWPFAVLEAALTSEHDRLRLAVHLLYYTGQRIGDVMKMRWNDIQGDRISVTQQKTGTALLIAMHPALTAELARHERKGMTILCNSETNGPMTDQVIRRIIGEHGQAHGCKIVPHGLRKNAVNSLLEAGCTRDEVRAVTGQSDNTIEHYAKRRDLSVLSAGAVLKWNAKK